MNSLHSRAKILINKLGETRNRRVILFAFFAVCIVSAALLAGPVHAATDTSNMSTGDTISLLVAQFLVNIAQIIGQIIITLIGIVVVPIMQYNEFATSTVVGTGWALVRDTMNIGFVIILLLIAFGTIIFGTEGMGGRFNWRKNLPTLLIFAILINFSRTICGIMIDFGQVIMLTFVNAIKDIAGGNFIQLFGLQDIMAFDKSVIQNKIDTGVGIDTYTMLAGALTAVVMMSIVLLTIITLIVLLAFRIVMLWVLVVLSPIAFLFGGAKAVIGGSFRAYDDWWSNFTAAVAIGPVLVFVLWLALAVAGSGDIASTENFIMTNSAEGQLVSGNPLKIFSMDKLVSFIIALGILYAGFDASMKIASSLPGSMKKLVGPGAAARIAKGVATTGARIGYRGAAAAGGAAVGYGMAAGRFGAGLAGRGLKAGAGKGLQLAKMVPIGKDEKGRAIRVKDMKLRSAEALQGYGKDIAAGGKKGALRAALGGAVGRFAGKMTAEERRRRQKMVADASKDLRSLDTDSLKAIAASPALTEEAEAQRLAAQHQLMTKAYHRNSMSSDELKEIRSNFAGSGGEAMIAGDDTMRNAMFDSGRSRLDMLEGDMHEPDSDFGKAIAGMKGSDFQKTVEAPALEDERVQELLKDKKMFVKGIGETSVWEAMKMRGTEAQQAKIREIESAQGVVTPKQQEFADMTTRMGQESANLVAQIAAATSEAQRRSLKEEQARMRVDHAGKIDAFISENPDFVKDIKSNDLNAGGGVLARHLALQGGQPIQRIAEDPQLAAAFAAQTRESELNKAGFSPEEKAQARASAFAVTGNLGPKQGQSDVVKMIMEKNPEQVGRLIQSQREAGPIHAQDIIAKNINKEVIENMLTKYEAASGAERDKLQESLNEVKQTLTDMGDEILGQAQLKEALTYLKRKSYKYS